MKQKMRLAAFRGVALALLSGFFSSCGAALVKSINDIHSLEIVIFRDIVQLVICGSIAIKQQHQLFGYKGERWFLLLRIFWGTISLSTWFVSVKYTKFGDAAAIYYSYPVFIGVLARIFLKEPFKLFHGVTVAMTILGILFISGPHYLTALFGGSDDIEFSNRDMIGVILATIGCFAQGCGNLCIRKLQKTPSAIVVVWFSIFSMVTSFILVPFIDSYKLPGDSLEWLRLFGVGCFGVLTQICITTALKLEKATPVSILEAFNMIVAFVFQVLIFHEPISLWSALGALLIAMAVVAITFYKYLETKKEEECDVQVVVTQVHDCDLPPEYSPPPTHDKNSGPYFIFDGHFDSVTTPSAPPIGTPPPMVTLPPTDLPLPPVTNKL